MSGSKTIRESRKLLEPLGYELVGWNQSSHLVYRHKPTGAVARVVNGFDATNRGRANMMLQARRNIREAESASRLWLNFVREQYEVGIDEEKLCVISMVSLVKRFRERYPGLRFSDKLPGVAMRQSPYVDHVKTGVYLVRGELFGVTPPVEEDEDVPVSESVREPVAAPVVAASGGAADAADGRTVQGAPADDEAGVDDPELDESDRADRGLSLPDALVQQLRAALGGDGDLEAENALLRETLTGVLGSLQNAAQTVEAALSLHGASQSGGQGRVYRLGPRRLEQLRVLRDSGRVGPFTGRNTAELFGMTGHNAGNVLWTFGQAGALRKVARGVYDWPEVAG